MSGSYLVEIDSSQRDVTEYPDPNNYVIKFNRPLYNISKISLVSIFLPLSQYTINTGNNTLKYDSIVVPLTKRDYSNGTELAANIQTDIRDGVPAASAMTVTFDPEVSRLTFSNTTSFSLTFDSRSPASVLGAAVPGLYEGTSITLSRIDLHGPGSLILSIDDNVQNEVFQEDYFSYFGRIFTGGGSAYRVLDKQDISIIENTFPRGTEPSMDSMHIRFRWMNFDEVFDYDFEMRNHVLKFKITCDLDKFIAGKSVESNETFSLPTALTLPEFENYRFVNNQKIMVYGGATIVLVLIILILSSVKKVKR